MGCYKRARRRLLVLGYNATLTTAVEAPRQPKKHFDQIQARGFPRLGRAGQPRTARRHPLLACGLSGNFLCLQRFKEQPSCCLTVSPWTSSP